jgi:G3E family GTPase
VLSALQPTAKIIKTTNSEVDLKEVLNTQRFDFEKASESAGWIKESLNLLAWKGRRRLYTNDDMPYSSVSGVCDA